MTVRSATVAQPGPGPAGAPGHPQGTAADHRKGPRRRGQELHRAIYDAVLAELAEVGYGGLTMEGVADRARAGKASLYRRWPTRAELVVDTIRHSLPGDDDVPDTGGLRGDLLALFGRIAAVLAGPAGGALRVLFGEFHRDIELHAARARTLAERRRHILVVLRRGVERGEVRSEALTLRVAEVGPVLLIHHFLLDGAPIPGAVITGIVDEVMLPLLAP